MSSATARFPDTRQAKALTDMLETRLRTPATSPEFDFEVPPSQAMEMGQIMPEVAEH